MSETAAEAVAILSDLRAAGMDVKLHWGGLRVAPIALLTRALRGRIRDHRGAIIEMLRGKSPPALRAVPNQDLRAIRAAREAREAICRACPKFIAGAVECGRVVRRARCQQMSACQWMHMMSSGAGKWPEGCRQLRPVDP